MREKVRGIFSLRECISIKPNGELKIQKITIGVEIFHFKSMTQEILEIVNTYNIISYNNYIVNLKEKNSDLNIKLAYKKS